MSALFSFRFISFGHLCILGFFFEKSSVTYSVCWAVVFVSSFAIVPFAESLCFHAMHKKNEHNEIKNASTVRTDWDTHTHTDANIRNTHQSVYAEITMHPNTTLCPTKHKTTHEMDEREMQRIRKMNRMNNSKAERKCLNLLYGVASCCLRLKLNSVCWCCSHRCMRPGEKKVKTTKTMKKIENETEKMSVLVHGKRFMPRITSLMNYVMSLSVLPCLMPCAWMILAGL